MKKVGMLVGLVELLAGCSTGMSPGELAAAQALVTVTGALVPGGAAVLAAGQLLCSDGGQIVAMVDQLTGQAWLVTGKAATTVANTCQALGVSWIPVAPTGAKMVVAAAAVVK